MAKTVLVQSRVGSCQASNRLQPATAVKPGLAVGQHSHLAKYVVQHPARLHRGRRESPGVPSPPWPLWPVLLRHQFSVGVSAGWTLERGQKGLESPQNDERLGITFCRDSGDIRYSNSPQQQRPSIRRPYKYLPVHTCMYKICAVACRWHPPAPNAATCSNGQSRAIIVVSGSCGWMAAASRDGVLPLNGIDVTDGAQPNKLG